MAAKAEAKLVAVKAGGGGDSSGKVVMEPETVEVDGGGGGGGRREDNKKLSVANGGAVLPESVLRAFGGYDAESDDGLSRRRKSRERARAIGFLSKGNNNSSHSQSQSQSGGESANGDGSEGKGVADVDAGATETAAAAAPRGSESTGKRALKALLREAQEKEKAMQKEVEVRLLCGAVRCGAFALRCGAVLENVPYRAHSGSNFITTFPRAGVEAVTSHDGSIYKKNKSWILMERCRQTGELHAAAAPLPLRTVTIFRGEKQENGCLSCREASFPVV